MSFEYKVYTRDQAKWNLLAGFKIRTHAIRFAANYQDSFRDENKPQMKIHQGNKKIQEF